VQEFVNDKAGYNKKTPAGSKCRQNEKVTA